jgi:hypothetical protein
MSSQDCATVLLQSDRLELETSRCYQTTFVAAKPYVSFHWTTPVYIIWDDIQTTIDIHE